VTLLATTYRTAHGIVRDAGGPEEPEDLQRVFADVAEWLREEVDVQLEPFDVLVRVPPRTGVGPTILAVSAGSDHLSLDAKIAATPRLAF
jgi:hypothetical protein